MLTHPNVYYDVLQEARTCKESHFLSPLSSLHLLHVLHADLLLLDGSARHQLGARSRTRLLTLGDALRPALLLVALGFGALVQALGNAGLVRRILLCALFRWVDLTLGGGRRCTETCS